MKLSIIVPLLNEHESLALLKEAIDKVATENRLTQYEIIFVDDGSTDRSYEVIKTLHMTDPEVVKSVRFSRNYGKAAALSVGIPFQVTVPSAVLVAEIAA